MVEVFVFVAAAAMVLIGAIGVLIRNHPVHSALSLVLTLFGVAVLFLSLDAQFLAAVQVIVYAGAIVVLFLFVIMLLGVDRTEDLKVEPIGGQRPLAAMLGVGMVGLLVASMVIAGDDRITGKATASAPAARGEDNVAGLARNLFGDYAFAFEATSVLLVIAVIATVILARRPPRRDATASGKVDQ